MRMDHIILCGRWFHDIYTKILQTARAGQTLRLYTVATYRKICRNLISAWVTSKSTVDIFIVICDVMEREDLTAGSVVCGV